jgi:hypothetical protein
MLLLLNASIWWLNKDLLMVLLMLLLLLKGENGEKIEYRVWNPFRSKLGAAILGGVDQIHIKPGAKVLYLGAASGTTVSHVSDIVGPVILKFWNILKFEFFKFC